MKKSKIVAFAVLVLILSLYASVPYVNAQSYDFQGVFGVVADDGGIFGGSPGVGKYTSIDVFDLLAGPLPYISYYDHANNMLKLAYRENTTSARWRTASVAAFIPSSTSLALNNNAIPHIAYFDLIDQTLKFALFDTSGAFPNTVNDWGIENVPQSVNVGRVSLVLDGGNDPHLAYRQDTGNGFQGNVLMYAEKRCLGLGCSTRTTLAQPAGEGTWTFEVVDSGDPLSGGVGFFASIVLDSNGLPHISYHDSENGTLKYAVKQSNGTWSKEVVDGGGATVEGFDISMALDSNDEPHISYTDFTPGHLKYATKTSVGWSLSQLETKGSFENTSIAVDATGNLHISYYERTRGGRLKYATKDAGATLWNTSVIDSKDDRGRYSSIALDSNGIPHISYYDATNGDLRYATEGAWTSDSIPPPAPPSQTQPGDITVNGGVDDRIFWGDQHEFCKNLSIVAPWATAVFLTLVFKEFSNFEVEYEMMPDNLLNWCVTIDPPRDHPMRLHGDVEVRVLVLGQSPDDAFWENWSMFVDPSGIVTDAVTGAPIEGSTVTLQVCQSVSGPCSTAQAGTQSFEPDFNPQLTTSSGGYGWDVLPGFYRVHVQKIGYSPKNSRFVSVPPEVTDLDVQLQPGPLQLGIPADQSTFLPWILLIVIIVLLVIIIILLILIIRRLRQSP